MNAATLSVLAVLALAMAGCTTPAAPGSTTTDPSAATPASPATAQQGAAPASLSATATGDGALAPPVALYFQADRTLLVEPAAAEGTVTLDTPVNGPETPGYPAFNGTLPRAVTLGADLDIPFVFYVAANTASIAANQLPIFAGLPGFFLYVTVGNATFEGEADGPPIMHSGHVYEVRGVLDAKALREFPAGEPVTFFAEVIYSHVTQAAEFRYVVGPEHPSGFVLGAAG